MDNKSKLLDYFIGTMMMILGLVIAGVSLSNTKLMTTDYFYVGMTTLCISVIVTLAGYFQIFLTNKFSRIDQALDDLLEQEEPE